MHGCERLRGAVVQPSALARDGLPLHPRKNSVMVSEAANLARNHGAQGRPGQARPGPGLLVLPAVWAVNPPPFPPRLPPGGLNGSRVGFSHFSPYWARTPRVSSLTPGALDQVKRSLSDATDAGCPCVKDVSMTAIDALFNWPRGQRRSLWDVPMPSAAHELTGHGRPGHIEFPAGAGTQELSAGDIPLDRWWRTAYATGAGAAVETAVCAIERLGRRPASEPPELPGLLP